MTWHKKYNLAYSRPHSKFEIEKWVEYYFVTLQASAMANPPPSRRMTPHFISLWIVGQSRIGGAGPGGRGSVHRNTHTLKGNCHQIIPHAHTDSTAPGD